MPRLSAHIAEGPTPRGVGLVEREECMVTTGRRDRRWVCSKFEMAEDLADHLALCDDGNDAERTTATKGTRGHIQTKDAAQQPGPMPVRGCRFRLLPGYPLLAQGGTDRLAQRAVWCQTPTIADEVDPRQRHG